MNNGNMPAYACEIIEKTQNAMGTGTKRVTYRGLTKREHFAGLAMQGILASKYYGEFIKEVSDTEDKPKGCSLIAVKMADALLKALDNE